MGATFNEGPKMTSSSLLICANSSSITALTAGLMIGLACRCSYRKRAGARLCETWTVRDLRTTCAARVRSLAIFRAARMRAQLSAFTMRSSGLAEPMTCLQPAVLSLFSMSGVTGSIPGFGACTTATGAGTMTLAVSILGVLMINSCPTSMWVGSARLLSFAIERQVMPGNSSANFAAIRTRYSPFFAL